MTAVFKVIITDQEGCEYDGTNGAAIVAQFTGCTFTSDTGGQLDFVDSYANPQTFHTGDVLLRINGGAFGGAIIGGSLAPAGYRYLAEASLAASSGSASVPASLLGQTAVYNVGLSPAMPSTDYVAFPQLLGAPNIVSGHSILSHTIVDEDTVQVTVQSGAASLAGASVYVQAVGVANG